METPLADPVVRLDNVSTRYPGQGQDRPALEIGSLTVRQGGRVALIGPSGGGKTTLPRPMNGTLSPSAGSIDILGDAPLSRER